MSTRKRIGDTEVLIIGAQAALVSATPADLALLDDARLATASNNLPSLTPAADEIAQDTQDPVALPIEIDSGMPLTNTLTNTLASTIDLTGDRAIDQLLVQRVQAGDKHAFELLVVKYQRKVHRLLSRFVRDQAEVEDIAQEAFIKAYRALPQFRGDAAFYTWLYRIAVNTAKNYLVSQGRKAPTTTDSNVEEAETFDDADQLRDISTPESLLMSKQVAQTVNQAMADLPEELRTAITLREIEGLSYDEIAAVMSCPIGTVRSRIFRAREAIAERLRPLLGTTKDQRW